MEPKVNVVKEEKVTFSLEEEHQLENLYSNSCNESDLTEIKKSVEISTDLRQMKKAQDMVKESMPGQMTFIRFKKLLQHSGKLYFNGQKRPIEKYIEILNIETPEIRRKSAQHPNNMNFHRMPAQDEANKKLYFDTTIEVLIDFQPDLRRLFTAYIAENYDKQMIMLTWEEIDMLNKKMTSISFIKMLIDANIIPTHLSIDSYAESQAKICPPYNSVETNFYSQEIIKKIAEKDIGVKSIRTTYVGDPCLSYYEFTALLSKIAIDATPKDQIKKERDLYDAIARYFSNVLHIRPKKSEQDWDFFKKNQTNLTSYFHRQFSPPTLTQHKQKPGELTQSSGSVSPPKGGASKSSAEGLTQKEDDEEHVPKFGEGLTPKFDLDMIHKSLQNDLPPLPAKYQPKKEILEVSKVVPKVIGEQPPKPPVDKQAKKTEKAAPKKKKGEEREIRWQDPPQPPPKTSYDLLSAYNDQLEFNNPFQIHQKSGVMSHIQASPVILEQVIYPQNIPEDAKKLLESSILNLSEQNYPACLENVNGCYEAWLNIEDRSELTLQNEIFFEYFRGTLFQSAGTDHLALSSFFAAKGLSDKLQMDSPDKALPFSGIGGICFRMEEYKLALRAFLHARHIIEQSIGPENTETATIYNNLGCCMLKLNRTLEAQTYFELAHALFDLEFGVYHTYTSTAASNLTKCKKQGIAFLPEFKVPWIEYEKDILKKPKPAKKDSKKGK